MKSHQQFSEGHALIYLQTKWKVIPIFGTIPRCNHQIQYDYSIQYKHYSREQHISEMTHIASLTQSVAGNLEVNWD